MHVELDTPPDPTVVGYVYLIHLDEKISGHAQHYIGWAKVISRRLKEHRSGTGGRLLQVAVERGIGFAVVRFWPGSRSLERYLKNRKKGPRLCPICNPSKHNKR